MAQPTTRSGPDGGAQLLTAGRDHLVEQGDYVPEHDLQLAGIGVLAVGIAQELANQLSVVKAAGDSLRYELRNNQNSNGSAAQHYLNLIERNTFRSAQIVALLQEFASLHEPQMAVTDIDAILRDTSMLVTRQFRNENNVTIAIAKPPETRSIVCDHNQIVQLLVFLLQDARQALSESGGRIDIEVSTCKKAACAEVYELIPAAADLIIIVITPAANPRPAAWKPTNGHAWNTRSEGDGFGLRIAREIAGQHDGHILLKNESDPGKGAAATLVLPVRHSI